MAMKPITWLLSLQHGYEAYNMAMKPTTCNHAIATMHKRITSACYVVAGKAVKTEHGLSLQVVCNPRYARHSDKKRMNLTTEHAECAGRHLNQGTPQALRLSTGFPHKVLS
jgi:hypothetical protein